MPYATRTSASGALSAVLILLLSLASAVAAAGYEGDARLLRLHLPVHLEGNQTVRLDRLVEDHYDIDLRNYLLRGIVIESDGYTDRRDAYARLQVGRYKTGRVYLDGGQTAIDAPAYRNTHWQLRLGSGARAHGLLLVLEEARYTSYRTRPHAGTTLGLGWYLGAYSYRYPDFYHRDRYRYGSLSRYYSPYYDPYYYRNHRDRRFRYRDDHRRYDRDHRRKRDGDRRHKRDRDHASERHRDRDSHPEHRQWRDSAGERAERHPRRRAQERQQQQVERALRGNHERARRPDRPNRQRIERAAADHRAQVRPQQRAQRRQSPQRAERRAERRSAPARSQRGADATRSVPRSSGRSNGGRRVHM